MSSEELRQEKVEKPETITTTIEVDKDLFLKFKAFCVLNETTISGEIEKLLRKRVEQMANKSESTIVTKESKE
ncbi:MAG: hypothetical protein NTU57_01735 [Candidatus Aenigmarchaeota archaeon]|nr:hypothetical protein [Candidatus Aenigmarchaeota archaeon]